MSIKQSEKLVVLCGPTASGKSDLAIDLARILNGEVVSADSMQVYIGMDIGTAKPTPAEQRGIIHHMIDVIPPQQEYSVSLYQKSARACITDIQARGKLPILCGGTGLYINAVLYPLDFADQPPNHVLREEFQTIVQRDGPIALHKVLIDKNPTSAATIHPNNVKRVMRALEKLESKEDTTVFNREPLYQLAWLGLTMEREKLKTRIDRRVDKMIEAGLVGEVSALLEKGVLSRTAAQAIGYKETIAYLEGQYSLPDAVEQIKRGTAQYAKRQMTWFRREKTIRWLDVDALSSGEDLMRTSKHHIQVNLGLDI